MPLILIGALLGALYVGTMSMLIFNVQVPLQPNINVQNQTPTANVTLYMGELSNGKFGFGYQPSDLSSPGPTLRLYTWDTVNITVVNAGKLPHAFAITTLPSTEAKVLFNAQIASAQSPLQPGQSGSVVFKPDNAGFSYCYISPVKGDTETGMWGTVTISTVTG